MPAPAFPPTPPKGSVTASFNTTTNVLSGTVRPVVAGLIGTIFVDGVPIATATTAADGTWSYATPLNAGAHTFRAVFGVSSPLVSVTINAAGPFTCALMANITVMAFAQGSRYQYTQAAFDAVCNAAWAADRLQAGMTGVRLAVDPSPMLSSLSAAGGPTGTQYAADKLVVTSSIAKYSAFGLKVLLDLHVGGGSGETVWKTVNIQNDYATSTQGGGTGTVASGNKWATYTALVADLATYLNGQPVGNVALELFNEPTVAIGGGWPAMVRTLWLAFRAVNTASTVILGGTHYNGPDGLQELTASNFDTNTGFVFHDYDPQQFTEQGFSGGPVPHSSRFPWPYNKSDAAALYATLASASGLAVSSVSVSGTTATVTTAAAHGLATGAYVNLFGGNSVIVTPVTITVTSTTVFTMTVPSGYTQTGGTYSVYYPEITYQIGSFGSAPFGADVTYLTSSLAPVESWRATNSVPATRIFNTENGIKRDVKQNSADINGASVLAASKYLQDYWGLARGYGYNVAYFTDDNATADLFDWRVTPGGPYIEPCIASAIGLGTSRTHFEREASDHIGRMSVTPSNKRCALFNAGFRLFKLAGLIPLMDGFWLLSHASVALGYPKADAMLNWFPAQPSLTFAGTGACVETAGGTFTDGQGYSTDGAVGYLDTLIAPGVTQGSVATQNAVGIFLHQSGVDAVSEPAYAFGNSKVAVAVRQGGLSAAANRNAGIGTAGCTLPYADMVVGCARNGDAGNDYVYTRGSRAYSGATLVAGSAQASATSLATATAAFGRASASNYAKSNVIMRSGALTGGLTDQQARDLSTIMAFMHLGLAMNP